MTDWRTLLTRFFAHGRRIRRAARRVSGRWRSVVVPLLDPGYTEHALDLACHLAVVRRTRVLVVAPLFVEWELPRDAHFAAEERRLRAELDRTRALAESYGIGAHGKIVRVRPGELGRGVADAAHDVGASLIVVGAPVESRRRFRHPFSRDVWSVLSEAPCPVMLATGSPPRARATPA